MLPNQILPSTIPGNYKKSQTKIINLKYLLHRVKILIYFMVHILYQDNFEFIMPMHEQFTVNPPIRIDVNKVENRPTFKIKRGY